MTMTNRKPFVNSLITTGLCGALLLLAGPSGAANVMGASAGRAYYPSDSTAFSRSYNQITVPDAGWAPGRFWTIDVQSSSTGDKTISAYGRSRGTGTFAGRTSCAALATAPDGSLQTWTSHVGFDSSSTPSWHTLGTITVASTNAVQVECFLRDPLILQPIFAES